MSSRDAHEDQKGDECLRATRSFAARLRAVPVACAPSRLRRRAARRCDSPRFAGTHARACKYDGRVLRNEVLSKLLFFGRLWRAIAHVVRHSSSLLGARTPPYIPPMAAPRGGAATAAVTPVTLSADNS